MLRIGRGDYNVGLFLIRIVGLRCVPLCFNDFVELASRNCTQPILYPFIHLSVSSVPVSAPPNVLSQVPSGDQLCSAFMRVHTRGELSSADWLMEKPPRTHVAPQVMVPARTPSRAPRLQVSLTRCTRPSGRMSRKNDLTLIISGVEKRDLACACNIFACNEMSKVS